MKVPKKYAMFRIISMAIATCTQSSVGGLVRTVEPVESMRRLVRNE